MNLRQSCIIYFLLLVSLVYASDAGYLDLKDVDFDEDGDISLDQFRLFISEIKTLQDHYSSEEIEQLTVSAFMIFDHNQNKKLQANEYEEMGKHMSALGPPSDLNQDQYQAVDQL